MLIIRIRIEIARDLPWGRNALDTDKSIPNIFVPAVITKRLKKNILCICIFYISVYI